MSGPVRIEGVVTEVHRDGSLGVIRGDDGSDYAYSGGQVYRGDKPLTMEGQRVEFEYQVGTSWPRMATAIQVLTLIGILEVPISRLISGAIEEVIRGSELERVNEVGPCPACGEQTLKVDTGGTRCVSCAIAPSPFPITTAALAGPLALARLNHLLAGVTLLEPKSCGDGPADAFYSVSTMRPCPPIALTEALRALAVTVRRHALAHGPEAGVGRAVTFLILPEVAGSVVMTDLTSGVSLRVAESARMFSFDVVFRLDDRD